MKYRPSLHIRAIAAKETLSNRTNGQITFVKENLPKKYCSLYTRASKASKELVKENLIACAGL